MELRVTYGDYIYNKQQSIGGMMPLNMVCGERSWKVVQVHPIV